MNLPTQFQFKTTSQGDLIFTAEQADGSHYYISWDDFPSRGIFAGQTTYGASFMRHCIRRKTWQVIEIQTNEQALRLLNED